MMRNYLEQNFKNTSLYENNPLISIIVPVYNTGSFLKSCLKSICNQTYKILRLLLLMMDPQIIQKKYWKNID